MAMTGGTSVLLKSTTPPNWGTHKVNLYAYYNYTQDTKTNLKVGLYINTDDDGWDIGSWTDNGGSYMSIGSTQKTFKNGIPSSVAGYNYWIVENLSFTLDSTTTQATIKYYWDVNPSSFMGDSWWNRPEGSFTITVPKIETVTSCTRPTLILSNDRVSMGDNLILSLIDGKDGIDNPIISYNIDYSISNGLHFSNWTNLTNLLKSEVGSLDMSDLVTEPNSYLAIRVKSLGSKSGYDSNYALITCRIDDTSSAKIFNGTNWDEYTLMYFNNGVSKPLEFTTHIIKKTIS